MSNYAILKIISLHFTAVEKYSTNDDILTKNDWKFYFIVIN